MVLGDKIIVTSHHHLYYPSQIAILDHQGRLLREYWHPGQLNALATGTYQGKAAVYVGGVSNVHDRMGATLVVLDPETLAGAAVEHGKPSFDGMPPGVELARVVFPRSVLSIHERYNGVNSIFSRDGRVIAHVHERLTGSAQPSIQYHFNDRLELEQVVVSDVFAAEYRKTLHHDMTPEDRDALHRLTRIQ